MRRITGSHGGHLIAVLAAVLLGGFFAAANSEAARNGINFFTEILRFPDRLQHTIRQDIKDDAPPESSEQMKFMDRFMKLEEEKINSLGGRPPLEEGPAKDAYEKDIMMLQSGVLFDLRLGAGHPKRRDFLAAVSWAYDRKLPIMKKMKRNIVAKTADFKKAEAEDFRLHDVLLVQVKQRFAEIFTPADYEKMLHQKIGEKGTD